MFGIDTQLVMLFCVQSFAQMLRTKTDPDLQIVAGVSTTANAERVKNVNYVGSSIP